MINVAYKIFLLILGAIIYRVRGGLAPALPRPFDQLLFALGYGAIIYRASERNIFWFAGVVIITTLALSTGHGAYMDLATVTKEVSPERLDFIVSAVFGPDTFNNFWRDAFGLAVTGLAVSLPCGIALGILKQFRAAVIVGLSGALKFPAYYISWQAGFGTELGEYLTGAFLWGPIILAWPMIKTEDL